MNRLGDHRVVVRARIVLEELSVGGRRLLETPTATAVRLSAQAWFA